MNIDAEKVVWADQFENLLDQNWQFLGDELTTRVLNVLERDLNLVTVRDLCRLTPRDLLRRKNFGGHSLANVTKVLGDFGLELGQNYAESCNALHQYGYWNPVPVEKKPRIVGGGLTVEELLEYDRRNAGIRHVLGGW